MRAQTIAPALLFATIFVVLLGSRCSQLIYRHLREHHREMWERLGRPTAFLNPTVAASRFLLRGQYKDLDDLRLNRLGSVWKATIVSFLAVLWLVLILFVVSQF